MRNKVDLAVSDASRPEIENQGEFPDDYPSNWASNWGVDRIGLWQSIQVSSVSEVDAIGGLDYRFRWIAAGEFWMGSAETEAERDDDETRHRVRLTQGFWLGETAVPQWLWQAVLGENPSQFKGLSKPVESVSWDQISDEFLPKLNQIVPELHAGLPSEAQWEYACRAGTETPFWFGEKLSSEKANYDGELPYAGQAKGQYRKETIDVYSFDPNAWGLYQMHGNVDEWCVDDMREYSGQGKAVDPLGEGEGRAIRGGSWNFYGHDLRSALRDALPRDDADLSLGFRLFRGPTTVPDGVDEARQGAARSAADGSAEGLDHDVP